MIKSENVPDDISCQPLITVYYIYIYVYYIFLITEKGKHNV